MKAWCPMVLDGDLNFIYSGSPVVGHQCTAFIFVLYESWFKPSGSGNLGDVHQEVLCQHRQAFHVLAIIMLDPEMSARPWKTWKRSVRLSLTSSVDRSLERKTTLSTGPSSSSVAMLSLVKWRATEDWDIIQSLMISSPRFPSTGDWNQSSVIIGGENVLMLPGHLRTVMSAPLKKR